MALKDTNSIQESLVYFDKTAQLAVVSFVCILFWVIALFNNKPLKLISLGFLSNFLYIFSSMLTAELFPFNQFFKSNVNNSEIFFSRMSDFCGILTSFFFIEGFISWHFYNRKNMDDRDDKIIINSLKNSKNIYVLFNGFLSFITFYFLFIPHSRYSPKTGIYCLTGYGLLGITALVILCNSSIELSKKRRTNLAKAFIISGFGLWDILQLIEFTALSDSEINGIGFTGSLIAKLCILYGALVWYVDIAAEKRTHEETAEQYNIILRNLFHDIYSPLGGVGNALQKISSKVSGDLKINYNELVNNFERVYAIVDRTKNTFDSTLGLPGSLLYEFLNKEEIVGVNYLIEQSVQSVRDTYKHLKSSNFQFSYGSSCNIRARRSDIIRILENIIKNSVESYSVGENINIKISSFKIQNPGSDSRYVCVEIEDTGSGINPANFQNIWSPGFSTKEKKRANDIRGQGLHIVKEILENYEGSSITVESPIQKKDIIKAGSKFILLFPIQKNNSNYERIK